MLLHSLDKRPQVFENISLHYIGCKCDFWPSKITREISHYCLNTETKFRIGTS